MDGVCPDKYFLEGDLDILRHCDAIVMIPGWELSQGAIAEHSVAFDAGIEIVQFPYDLHKADKSSEKQRENA